MSFSDIHERSHAGCATIISVATAILDCHAKPISAKPISILASHTLIEAVKFVTVRVFSYTLSIRSDCIATKTLDTAKPLNFLAVRKPAISVHKLQPRVASLTALIIIFLTPIDDTLVVLQSKGRITLSTMPLLINAPMFLLKALTMIIEVKLLITRNTTFRRVFGTMIVLFVACSIRTFVLIRLADDTDFLVRITASPRPSD